MRNVMMVSMSKMSENNINNIPAIVFSMVIQIVSKDIPKVKNCSYKSVGNVTTCAQIVQMELISFLYLNTKEKITNQ